MPEGTVEWFGTRDGCGFVVPERASSAIATVERAGLRILNEDQRLAYDPREGRRFSAVSLRPVDRTGASVLSHFPGERSGPLAGTIGLPDQPQSAGE
jgi:cold shock CspA family protein